MGPLLTVSTRLSVLVAAIMMAVLAWLPSEARAQSGSWGLPMSEVTVTPGKAQFYVEWTSVGGNNYELHRYGGGAYDQILVTSSSGGSYTDTNVQNGQTYWYFVFASVVGQAKWSRSLEVQTTLTLDAPWWVTAGAGKTSVDVTWEPVGDADTYTLQYSTSLAGSLGST